ncbi:MAG: hypothetical protein K6A38_03790 [Lachnospiraceae bacterium]|nr:hypothetical protein [Lachnospiraceae bacterium]
MTSKRSFSAKNGIDSKQKIWMWILSILTMLLMYPAVLIIYLNRILAWYPTETPVQKRIFGYQMKEAVCDALGYRESLIFCALGVVFAIGIFSFLNNRSKVDLIKSLPVKAKKMYASEYVSGVIICLIPYLVCTLLSVAISTGWGYFTALAAKECVITFILNTIVFLIYYNLTIVCICLTGNMFVAFGGVMAVSFGPYLIVSSLEEMKYLFFKSADAYFADNGKLLAPFLYTQDFSYQIKELNDIAKEMAMILPSLIWWAVAAVILTVLSYVCFIKRPAEAMHKAIWSKSIRTIVKLILIPAAAIVVSMITYQTSAQSKWIMVVSAIITAILAGFMIEAIYSFDIRAAFKSLRSTGLGALIAIAVLVIYFFDLTGYDRYVPKSGDIESYAVETNTNMYSDFYEIEGPDGEDMSMYQGIRWINSSSYKKEHMFLNDCEAISRLAGICNEKALLEDDTLINSTNISVLYRLKSGRKVTRSIRVDLDDAESLELLNRIVKNDGFLENTFASVAQKDKLDKINAAVSYSNGVGSEPVSMNPSDIIDLWLDDAEAFDYSLGYGQFPCGVLNFTMNGGLTYQLPVYENFKATINAVKKDGSYLAAEFDAADVDRVIVTNYHNEVWENGGEYYGDPSVSETIEDPEDIKEILKNTVPSNLYKVWEGSSEGDGYSVMAFFNNEYEYSRKGESFMFRFTGDVPEWVKELTDL